MTPEKVPRKIGLLLGSIILLRSKAGNTRLEMTADLREKDQHILKSTSMKQQENPADFSSVHKVQAFFAQICCHFTPCISRFKQKLLS